MFCHSCGNEVPEKAKFCPECGTEVIVKKVEKKVEARAPKNVSKVYKEAPSDNLVRATQNFKGISRNKVLVALLAGAIIIVGVQVFGGGGSSSSGGYSNDDYYDKDYQNNKDDDDYNYNYKHEEHMVTCTSCFGSGECNGCDGSGKDSVFVGGTSYITHNCNYCFGSGKCRICGGDGKR